MLARCPKCDQRFGVVGSGATACPFCRVEVEVRVQRLVGAPQVAHARGPVQEAFAPMPPSLPLGALPDKISSAPSAPAPEIPPPPRLGPPRSWQLFLQPAEFFARLERGRPRLRPWAGAGLLLAGGAVQGASLSGFMPGSVPMTWGAAFGASLALTLLFFLLTAYRIAVSARGPDPQLSSRVWTVVGYGFVPMAFGLIPYGGLPAALGTCAAAHSRGLEHHLGLPVSVAQGTVWISWLGFAAGVAVALFGGLR